MAITERMLISKGCLPLPGDLVVSSILVLLVFTSSLVENVVHQSHFVQEISKK